MTKTAEQLQKRRESAVKYYRKMMTDPAFREKERLRAKMYRAKKKTT